MMYGAADGNADHYAGKDLAGTRGEESKEPVLRPKEESKGKYLRPSGWIPIATVVYDHFTSRSKRRASINDKSTS